ncbi:MAG: apolipoprotein A1/A4/E family protein [Sphingomonadaceae bacterium]|nr:apolipoprotein A1/A4/E family protein [Sphingomonadaceae bacterium]
MANSKNTPNDDLPPEPSAKSHFSKAVEEAKAGAQALGKEAQGRAEDYRDKLSHTTEDLSSKGREKSGEAKDKAYEYADQGKAKASEAISGLGKKVEENAAVIDETVGVQYGNYARSAASTIQDAATKLDDKSLEELGDDAKEFVREKPALAVGLAAAAGYMLARLFRRR